MKVLFASSEIFPYAKSGGLADVAGALPLALSKHARIISVMPFYGFMNENNFEKSDISFSLDLGGINYDIIIYKTQNQNLSTYLIKAPLLSDTQKLYGDSEAYANNDIRFGIFSKAIVKLASLLKVDIIHLNDWHSALAALWNKEENKQIKTIFTIHNLAYQGIFEEKSLQRLGIDKKYFNMQTLEFYGKCNFMKAGIKYSDAITTVSPNYAKEILTPSFGCGLDGFLCQFKSKLSGIINGIDITIFDPQNDKTLAKTFDQNTLGSKAENKRFILKKSDLKNENFPLFVMISRLTEQKGFDILLASLEKILENKLNVILLVDGESHYKKALLEISESHKNFKLYFGFNEELSHQIYAGADFFLMPSLFEPCGLAQMIAFRYASIPIVHDTGGLHDSVHEKTLKCGRGISFKKPTNTAFKQAIKRALKLYEDKKKIKEMQIFNMKCDFSFDQSALKYLELYKKLLS
ncbi:MAG: glycogen synthase [Sulfurospirillaceae bacterium]|nr:glycogen synthase [Sulfurospirillaceae bacterium]